MIVMMGVNIRSPSDDNSHSLFSFLSPFFARHQDKRRGSKELGQSSGEEQDSEIARLVRHQAGRQSQAYV